jgi:DNA-binding transcriptional MerR regulator
VGRGNHYTADHLDQLLRVKAMQEAGRTLDEIRRAFGQSQSARAGGEPIHEEPAMSRSLWRRIALTSSIELHVANTVRLPSSAKLQELAEWCRLHFADPDDKNQRDENRHA